MFFFGDPADTAALYWDRARGIKGPLIPDIHYDEMGRKHLRILIVYARMAYQLAESEQQPKEVLDVLMTDYDLLFERMCEISPDFVDAVGTQKHQPLGGFTKENIKKYRDLAGIAEDYVSNARE